MRCISTKTFILCTLLCLTFSACQPDEDPVPPCNTSSSVQLTNTALEGRNLQWAALTNAEGQILEEHFFTSPEEAITLSAGHDCESALNLALMYEEEEEGRLLLDYFTRLTAELSPDYSAKQPELLPTTVRITGNYELDPAFIPIDPRFGNTLEGEIDEFNHITSLRTGIAEGQAFIVYMLKDDAWYRYRSRRDEAEIEIPADSIHQQAPFLNCKFKASFQEAIIAGIDDGRQSVFTPYYSNTDSLSRLDISYPQPLPGDFSQFYLKASGDFFQVERFTDAPPELVERPNVFLLFDNIEFPNHFRILDPEDAQADLIILQHKQTPGLRYRVFHPARMEEVQFTPLDSLALQDRFPRLSPAFSPASLNYSAWDERTAERYQATDDYRQLLEGYLSEPPLWKARLGYEADRSR